MSTEEEKRLIREAAQEDPVFARKFNIQVSNNVAKTVGDLAGTGIVAIQIHGVGEDWADIWRNGAAVTPAHTIPDGGIWQLRVLVNVSSTFQILWKWAVTVVATPVPTDGDLAGSGKDTKVVQLLTGGTYNDNADFNMGPMPVGNVSLRVKCWVSDSNTADPPPDSGATAW